MGEHQRVLIVEDDAKLASLLARSLTEAGFVAHVAGWGEEALAKASVDVFDAVVIDVGLPGMNGFETCRTLRDQGSRASVVIISAFLSADDRAESIRVGADHWLGKPFRLDELSVRLNDRNDERPLPSCETNLADTPRG